MTWRKSFGLTVALLPLAAALPAADTPALDEFKVQREPVFAFASAPTVTRAGDRVTVTFETKAFCDATVAIEDADGRIVRHLACGVLGRNAPPPFQKNAKKQALVWDGKDDRGRYVGDLGSHTVRVSLGLTAEAAGGLFWSPYKRFAAYPPVLCATKEGVYVFEGRGVDHLRLYDHDGTYVRTVYPFPAEKVGKVVGLKTWTVLQTGQQLPRKIGYQQATLLTSGTTASMADVNMFGDGYAAATMAVRGRRIALAYMRLNRLASDGSTGGLPLAGPETGFTWESRRITHYIGPTSSAFDPTGKWLYLTGYVWKDGLYGGRQHCRHVVYRLAYDEDAEPRVFAGDPKPGAYGTDNAHFAVPTSVACDAHGRVYVSDYMNDRVQVFAANGDPLKSIPAAKPGKVLVDPRSGEIYVFSWHLDVGIEGGIYRDFRVQWTDLKKVKPTLTRLGPLENPKKLGAWALPLPPSEGSHFTMGQRYHFELDFWGPRLTLWLVPRKPVINQTQVQCWGVGVIAKAAGDKWMNGGILLRVVEDGEWVAKRSFAQDAYKAVVRVKPPDMGIQRLYVNEVNHKLYLLEHLGFSKANHELIEIDPRTARIRTVAMPFGAEDLCFDREGHVYLRTDHEVVRYDSRTWQEVPWDYGEQRRNVSFGVGPGARVASALAIPGHRPMWFHQYGMWVSPRGHLAVSCCNARAQPGERTPDGWKSRTVTHNAKTYTPTLYPGRARHQEIHIWDRHGKLICEDAVPGLGVFDGLGIDKDDNLYVMSHGTRNLGGKAYPNRQTGTLIKFRPRRNWGDVKVLSSTQNTTKRYVPFAPLPLSEQQWPKRPPDTVGGVREVGRSWMHGAEWFYGGVGISGAGCSCWHARFSMDGFARCFAVEPDLYSVAVLDTGGNLILRVGRYGNVDDPGVSLFYPAYVAADTDRSVFVSDVGNGRIVRVKLDYALTRRLPLKDVAGGRPQQEGV